MFTLLIFGFFCYKIMSLSNAACKVTNLFLLSAGIKFPPVLCIFLCNVFFSFIPGGSDNSKVGLGGDSAGGTITASVAHDVPMDFQVYVHSCIS